MTQPLANRIALVTGASRGIGYATALALAKRGAHVIATARTVGGLEDLDDAIRAAGGSATLVPLDIRDYGGIAELAESIQERYGRLDILVGNAGHMDTPTPLTHLEQKEWDNGFATNVTANLHLIRSFDPLLRASDAGRVVFVSSGVTHHPMPYFGLYTVTKAALDAMARIYAAETENSSVRVNLFTPGRVRTSMHARAFPGIDPETIEPPEGPAEKIADLCLPSMTETGKVYAYPMKALLSFQPPA
ncbi:MAG TPA: SDR family NAD(P)-dependent oxidoreductase [Xanthobacteraceae bacterium]|nr:SDR family NAD(P)-dependent oxidoreductase [Xanthobacteraceae bacterium]